MSPLVVMEGGPTQGHKAPGQMVRFIKEQNCEFAAAFAKRGLWKNMFTVRTLTGRAYPKMRRRKLTWAVRAVAACFGGLAGRSDAAERA